MARPPVIEPGERPRPPLRLGTVGTFPPTACGLATFTENARAAILAAAPGWSSVVIRLVDSEEPDHRTRQWVRGDRSSMERAARELDGMDVVLLQHEFGIFGGPDGSEVIEFLHGVLPPMVTVLHTVIERPTRHQRQILDALVERSSGLVVLSDSARDRLVAVHGIPADDVVAIPHGAAPNVDGPVLAHPWPTVLTWGLLGPGKGVEHGIDAVALLADRQPDLRYLVAGRTHPRVVAAQGEAYRDALVGRAEALGVADRVVFDDSYRSWDSLLQLIRSVDVVLIPYDSTDQVTSGVLVEALASARPLVATSFPHARELLAGGAGRLVGQGDPAAIATAIGDILGDRSLRDRLSGEAWRVAQPLLWPAVGRSFVNLLAACPRTVAA